MQIIEVELSKLKEYENNPRHNDKAVEAVQNSIASFGFKVPIIIDKEFYIVAGHTRRKAALNLKLKTVPCIIADDLTDEQIKAFRLADNKTAELAEWDFIKLEQELLNINIDMEAFGFDPLDFEVEPAEAQEDNFNIDAATDEITEPITKLGDIWQLGNHRLMCGDSTDNETVLKLMDGARADLVLTDPPYNVNYEGGTGLKIQNDNMAAKEFRDFLTAAFKSIYNVMREGAAFYIWYASREHLNFETALNNAGLEVRQQLIWCKNALILGRSDYQWKHEPCLYGWKEGAAHYFIDSRIETTIIDDMPNFNKMNKEELKDFVKELIKNTPASTIIRENKPTRNAEHPTMKPVKLMGYLIKNSTKNNEAVLDLFGGSGTTLIACEQLNRTCYMNELDPKYCDVIIKRWETLTGNKAVLLNDTSI